MAISEGGGSARVIDAVEATRVGAEPAIQTNVAMTARQKPARAIQTVRGQLGVLAHSARLQAASAGPGFLNEARFMRAVLSGVRENID